MILKNYKLIKLLDSKRKYLFSYGAIKIPPDGWGVKCDLRIRDYKLKNKITKNKTLLNKITKNKMKNIIKKTNTKTLVVSISNIWKSDFRNVRKSDLLTFIFVFSFCLFSIFHVVQAVDTTPPTVDLSYTSNPAGKGVQTITATYSEPISSDPTISIDQPGSSDIVNATMVAPGSVWTGRSETEANSWNSVTYGNGLFVAVASSGTNRVMTSPDGITWTARTTPEANGWNSVTYGNGLFVAVAGTGTNRAMTSPDGINWTIRTTISTNSWQSVTYGNGLFVAVSNASSSAVMTSPDGINWTARNAAEASTWISVTYGNNLFVAVAINGTNRVMTSPDGINWTARSASQANSWNSVTYGNGLFVAVASSGTNRVMTSPDGITWTNGTAPGATSWQSVIYTNTGFVSVANGGTYRVMTSLDGITWVARTAPDMNWKSVVYGNNLFVAVASYGTTDKVMTSPSRYLYEYTVNQANGSTYIDGLTTVSLSSVTDMSGNVSENPTNNTFTIDTTGPNVTLAYSSNPAKAGTNTITATYSEAVTTAPYISINQKGSIDILNVQMSGSGTTYTYNYTVNTATGNSYIDGEAKVSLSTVLDVSGKPSSLPTNNFFIIDTTAPVLTYTYSSNPVKAGTQTITATYNEEILGTPTISIDQPGSVDISGGSLTNSSGSIWTQRNMASSSGWTSVVYGNGLFVAVSSAGIINTSPNGITWTARTAPESNSWKSITYGNGLFVAVSYSGTNRVMTSPDGITWTARSASEANSWYFVTYGNGLFVAVAGDGTNRVMTSPDGINWTARTTPEANTWSSVTYGNGLFVAVASSGTNRVMTSPDGITWTARSASEANTWNSVTYGNGLFVAVASFGTNRVMTSPDGITWTARSAVEANQWRSVKYGDGIYVAVADSGTNRVMTSPDGIIWTARSTGGTQLLYSITYGKGLFCGVGTFALVTAPSPSYSYTYTVNQADGSNYIDGNAIVSLSSVTDLAGNALATPTGNIFVIDTTPANVAITYSRNPANIGVNKIQASYSEGISTAPTISIDQPGSSDITNATMVAPGSVWTTRFTTAQTSSWNSVVYGNGLFVATGYGRVITSPDGITWTTMSVSENHWKTVTYGNGLFVTLETSGGYYMTSPDGITWTLRTLSQSGQWNSITYGNGLFVAVGSSGTNRVITSQDGITWTARSASEVDDWRSVTYGNGLFVAVAYSGKIMTSQDGITWTSRNFTNSSIFSFSGVAYGNGLFVAVSYSSTYGTQQVVTSLDGINWTNRTSAQANGWNSVTYGNGLFVAVAGTGTNRVMTSPDGITWTARSASEANGWRSITYGNGLFVAVASSSTSSVMTSPASYTYDYVVNQANGSTYIDGPTIVSLSSTTDLVGNISNTPTGNTFTIDTTPTSVALSYSKNPAGVGTNTITATYSRAVVGAPNISINQPGSIDISNVSMTGSGTVFTYNYTVNQATGSTYIDGTATVSLSTMTDIDGGTAGTPTNTTFVIDTIRPTASITYDINHQVKSGDSLVITATFSEPMADAPIPQISISGVNTLALTDMTKTDTTHYTYTYSVGAGNGTATISLGTGTDIAGNIITATPTSGATFIVDNTLPSSTITAICSVEGNGCTGTGQFTNPQEPYKVQAISGIASDDLELSLVNISIKDTNTNKWYNGTSFVDDAETYLPAVGTTTWTYDSSALPLIIGNIYSVNVKPVDVAGNSQVSNLSFKFTNSPPVVSNVSASENSSGIVSVSYDVTDIESSQTNNSLFYKTGITLSGDMASDTSSIVVSNGTLLPDAGTIMIDDEMISYTTKNINILSNLTRGALNTTAFSHATGADIYALASSATGTGIGLSNKGTEKTITWQAKIDADGYENVNGVVRVVANDGSVGSMIGLMDSAPFIFDAKKPTINTDSLLINGIDENVESISTNVILKLQNITGNPLNENIFVQFSRDGGVTWYGANANGTLSGVGTMGTGFSSNPTIINALSWPWTMQSRTETITVKITDSFNNSATDTNTVGYNNAPEFNIDFPTTGNGGVSVSQILDNTDSNWGKVKVQYSIRDTDTITGALPNFITPTFSYDTGSGWNTISASDISYDVAPENGQIIDQNSDGKLDNKVSATDFYTYTIYWTPPINISTNSADLKVELSDSEPINSTSFKIVSNIKIDTTAPNLGTPITFDAGIAGVSESGMITIPMPTDISSVEYKISDDPETQTDPVDTGWVSITQGTTIPWTFDSDVEAKAIKYQLRDSYGNTTTETITRTQIPVPSSSFLVQDTSNISATPPYYDMYIGWQVANSEGFSSYKLEYATSADNIIYSAYNSIIDSGLSIYSTNYYIHRNLNPNLYYKYRLGVIGVSGNVSVRSNAFTIAKPDGVQNYGEGGGGSVATASKVENVVVMQDVDKTISVNYKLTDSSLSKKLNPSYEGSVYYNIGITLPSNSFTNNTLTVSDASKLKSSGYILINNEVIKYENKNGNILGGLTRGTWSGTIGRVTRTNTTFFTGTPVWVLASGTTPNSITNTSITTGQDETITWNTFEELSLAGNLYSNVGIKVLVHDNQDALSGPLSNQNDYSENGILNILDLTAPYVSFSQSSGAGVESVSPIVVALNLSNRYPYNTTANYTLSGTANSFDYTLTSGIATINAGDTTVDITIPVTSDTLKEEDETIIITLSSPSNGTLGVNTIYTYTITDDDNASGIQFTNTESSGAENITSVDIPITLSEISGANTTVAYTISGTATAEDYTLANGTATILAGETTTNITIPIINDILKEESETIILTLSDPTNATLGANTIYTYTITDDDLFPTLAWNTITGEGQEDINTVNIPISITAPYAEDVTFDYTVTGGTAEGSSVDYLLPNGTATILAGETTMNIPITIFDDEISEDTETILITISNLTNATLGTNSIFAYSILDNEIAVTHVNGSSIKSTSARITWTTADFTDSLVEYGTISPGTDGAYSMSKINTEKVLEHNMYLANLTPSTKYYFKTTSTNLAGESTTSESDFTTTAGPIISNVAVFGTTDTGATITWTTDIPSNSYVSYSINSDLSTPLIFGSVDLVTEHSVVLNGLNSDKVYYFLVSSTDESNNIGEDANGGTYFTFTTGADATPPVISDINVPIITASQVAIIWKTNEQSDSMIRYGTTTGNYENNTELISTPMFDHMVAISELSENTQYYYVVESKDEKGNTAVSEEQTFSTTEKEKVIVSSGGGGVIGVAQQLYDILLAENQLYKSKMGNINSDLPVVSDIEISETSAFSTVVSFNTSEDAISFIEYGKDKKYDLVATSKTWSRNHKIKLTGLSMGTDYYFKISAMDRTNDTGYSDEQSFKTKFFSENLAELTKIENIEQFQAEIESTIESILPSLVPPFIDKPIISDITENSAKVTFKTNIKAYPIVSYATDAVYDAKKTNPYDGEISDTTAKNITHTLQLIGLKSNTKYHLMAKAFSLPQVVGKGEDLFFTTKASKIRASIIEKKNDSFTVVWNTDEPTSSVVEYRNIKNGKAGRMTDEAKNTSHSVKVENLTPGSTYEVNISGVNAIGNIVEGAETIIVNTSVDITPPTISNFKVDSALVVGRTDRTQTIVSWTTDEPSTSIVSYEEGAGTATKELANRKEDFELTMNHVAILTTLKPGTVYRFQVASIDNANNMAKLPVRTIITPRPNESIVDVIFKNFDETFNFIKNVR